MNKEKASGKKIEKIIENQRNKKNGAEREAITHKPEGGETIRDVGAGNRIIEEQQAALRRAQT